DPVLFEGTIRDNLDPMNKYTDKEVWDAINACQISELLDEPTGKYVYDPVYNSDGPWIEGVGLQKWIKSGHATFSA
ncbi:Multidrug resistance-associated protein 5, partial [Coemansia sp. RSA 2599]